MKELSLCILSLVWVMGLLSSKLGAEDLDQNGCPDSRNSVFQLAGESFCCSVGASGFSRNCMHRDNDAISIGESCKGGVSVLRFYSDVYGICSGENCQGPTQLPTVLQSAVSTRYLECRSGVWTQVCTALSGAFNSCRAHDLFCAGDKFSGFEDRTLRNPFIEFTSTEIPQYTSRVPNGCAAYSPQDGLWTKAQLRDLYLGRAAVVRNSKLNSILNLGLESIQLDE